MKWDGYPSSSNSWEPHENVETVEAMVKEFEARYCPDADTEINLQDVASPILKKISKPPKHSHKEKKEKKHSKKKDRAERQVTIDTQKNTIAEPVRPSKPETKAIPINNVEDEEEEEFEEDEEEEVQMPRITTNNGDLNFDIPLIITEHSCFGNKENGPQTLSDLVYKVEFKTEGGKKKNPTFYTFNVLKAKCPELLLDYLQKSVKF